MFSQATLRGLMSRHPDKAVAFYPFLVAWMRVYAIDTRLRIAAFLATLAHESIELTAMSELGGAEYLSKYDTGRLAKRLGNTPEADGDGQKFKGRGGIMLTGHDNYAAFAKHKGMTLDQVIAYLETPNGEIEVSCWFWSTHGCNNAADLPDFQAVTIIVNGGLNGWEDRQQYYSRALQLLDAEPRPDFSNVVAGGASTAPRPPE